ncbi:MAG TPA: MogA/MoaB family molybdenum cofactor biosynthesis protein [Chloroflexota bacterium]|jgi:molybdenum cofactor synthesis domain-containing protein|nr:MogA/MoaB family molybdenum cofactor biosynthesis protein [Chloroflexota bacterium]
MRVGVLTISDRVSLGEMEDRGGAAVIAGLRDAIDVIEIVAETLPDDGERIIRRLGIWADEDQLDAIITTGGTGLGPRDVTPEATLEAIDKRVPGIEEALRAAGLAKLPMAMLSRGVAGVRGQTLIVNLPGSPTGAAEGTAILAQVLPHAIDLLHGRTRHGG